MTQDATQPARMAAGVRPEDLTSPGVAVGTVAYMSPEQVRGKELDARTDLFSFGVVFYEMATGAVPFRGETSGVITEAILNRAPVAPVRLNPELPAKLEDIINKALEKDRDLRYQAASDIRTDLKRLRRDTDSGRISSTSGRTAQEPTPLTRAAVRRGSSHSLSRRLHARNTQSQPFAPFCCLRQLDLRPITSGVVRTRPAGLRKLRKSASGISPLNSRGYRRTGIRWRSVRR